MPGKSRFQFVCIRPYIVFMFMQAVMYTSVLLRTAIHVYGQLYTVPGLSGVGGIFQNIHFMGFLSSSGKHFNVNTIFVTFANPGDLLLH